MRKLNLKQTLIILSAVVVLTHLGYVLLGNLGRAAGGTGGYVTMSNILHGITCLVLMWFALLLRDRFQPNLLLALLAYIVLVSALCGVCLLIELPLTTLPGGQDAVLKAMLLCWIAFMLWGLMLMAVSMPKIMAQAKLEAVRDEALEKQKQEEHKD